MINFSFILTVKDKGSVTQKLIVQQPRPLSVHFESQGDSTGRPLGGNLSPIAIWLEPTAVTLRQVDKGLQNTDM